MKRSELIENMANKLMNALFEGKSAQYRSDCCDAVPKNEWYLKNERCSECGENCEYIKVRNEGIDFDEFLDAGDAARGDIENEFGEDEFSPLGDQENYDDFVKSIDDPKDEPTDWDKPFSNDPEEDEIKDLLKSLEEGMEDDFQDIDFGGTIRMKEDIKPTGALTSGEDLLKFAQDLETSLGNFDHDIRKTTQHTPSGTIHGYSDSGVSPRELQQMRDKLSHAIVSYLVKYDELPHLMSDIMDNINHLLTTNGMEPIVIPNRRMIPVNEAKSKTMNKKEIEKLRKEREAILKQLKEGYYDDQGDYVGDDFEDDEWIDENPEGREFSYYINLDERDEFYADVRDPDGNTVFEIHGGDIFEDGFMSNKWDLNGLKDHLVDLGIMDADDDLTSETPSYLRRESLERERENILKELNMLEYGVNNRLEFIEKPNGLLIKLYDVEDFKDEFDGKVINAVDILEYGGYLGNGWEDATENFSNALTNSPIIGKDLELDEETGMWYATDGSEVYWFPNYQVEDPWETLQKTGEVFFQKGT